MSETKPTTLARYFWEDLKLSPDYATKEWRRSKWMLRLQWFLIKSYWKKRKPVTYAQYLCSLLSTAFANEDVKFRLAGEGNIVAPADVVKTTQRFADSITLFKEQLTPHSLLTRHGTEMSWLEWSAATEVTDHIWGHIRFIWTCATILDDKEIAKSLQDKESISLIAACMPSWVNYLEQLLTSHIANCD